ncbi:hypothetical protein N7495_004142 [Penicillium taxi]|uniref:uncharacterized protein n=1 Tax=Penicillium taxi TaxID=168475 RepID=UPI002545789A|nr:uncharacterized protein N7495_004142 [Penicillium taxi]KAJ5899398.1 hypothetical protein N7495_004142 [Penicillium taxi]
MPRLPQITRLLRKSAPIARVSLSPAQVACLHQQGPSRSTVVHERALPSESQSQSQSQPKHIAPVSQTDPDKIDAVVSQIPLVQALRQSHQTYKESRPHLAIPPELRQHHFIGGSLAGTGKLALAPYLWISSPGEKATNAKAESTSQTGASSLVSVFHIGRDLCGHPGYVHGGLLSVLLDEAFARCVSAAFPSGLGMTANLNVDFRKPAIPDRIYILRAETVKVDGRKAWVEGRLTCLPLSLPTPIDARNLVVDLALLSEDSEGAAMVAEAKALFIEPKFASSMVSVYGS